MTQINKRPDAATRRAQLLDAADLVFSTHGVNAPLELIVEHAGVGRATLYRQFPDRHNILLALMERSALRLRDKAREQSHRPEAFFELLQVLAERIVTSPAISDYWRTTGIKDPRFAEVRLLVFDAFAPALALAQKHGLVTRRLQAGDISLLSGMLGAGLRGEDEAARRQLVDRALAIITRGLQPDADEIPDTDASPERS